MYVANDVVVHAALPAVFADHYRPVSKRQEPSA